MDTLAPLCHVETGDSILAMPPAKKSVGRPAKPVEETRAKPRQFRLEKALDAALEAAHEKTRLPYTTIVTMALEAHLATLGLWPPAPAPAAKKKPTA
jgi:hypothetical protein